MVYPYSSANRTVNKNQINYSVKGGDINPTLNPNTVASANQEVQNVDLWKIDMGRETNFTVQISGILLPKMKHKLWGPFLPVKSLDYTPVAIETTKMDRIKHKNRKS